MLSILLIDDDPDVLTAVGDYLSTREHRVFPTEGGAEGLEILRREEIDIVITDIRMPGTDGFEVLREVRKTSPGTEVIMVTGYGDIDAAVQAIREGAFTDARQAHQGFFEQADGGTLFLDEIGDMDQGMQAALLRTLQERRVRPLGGSKEIAVNVRVVSATNQDLPGAISEGRFREDLFYRLNTFSIRIPPLRERVEDILSIAKHFLEICKRDLHKSVEGISPEAEAMLEAHPFRGNVRELRNLVEHAVILCKDGLITRKEMRFEPSRVPRFDKTKDQEEGGSSDDTASDLSGALRAVSEKGLNLSGIEAKAIREALRRTQGNQGQAAALLGLSRFALRRRMGIYGIEAGRKG